MTADNPDQDDFDPALDEGAEDFSYEEESFGDEEFSEEESWDESDEEGAEGAVDDQPESKPVRKKGGFLKIILVLLVVLGGGAVAYIKVLAPGGNPVAQEDIAQETAQAPAEIPAPQAVADISPVAPEAAPAPEQQQMVADPLLPAPGELEETQTGAPAVEMVPEIDETPASPENAAVTPVMSEQQPVEVASAPPMPAPISVPSPADAPDQGFNAGLPSAKDIMIAQPTPATESTSAPAEGISADTAKSIEQKLSVLLARLDTFEGRITNLESGVHQVSGKITDLESKPEPVADMDSVNTSIKALEQKIAILQKDRPAAPVTEEDPSKLDKPTFIPAAQEEPESPVPAVAMATDTPKAEVISKPAVKSSKPAVSPKAAGWVLRSAQPGSAMVASKSGGDMKSVSVGDSLSGIGKIILIEQQGNRWVVQGTQGSLTN